MQKLMSVILVFVVCPAIYADTVYLKSGKTIADAEILSEGLTYSIKVSGATINIPADLVDHVEKQVAPAPVVTPKPQKTHYVSQPTFEIPTSPEIQAIEECQQLLRDENRGYTDSCVDALTVIKKLYIGAQLTSIQIDHAFKYIDNPMMWNALERTKSPSVGKLKEFIEDPDGKIQTNLRTLYSEFILTSEQEVAKEHEAFVTRKALREGQIKTHKNRREYELAFEQYVQQKFLQETGVGPLPTKDWFEDDGTTRMIKGYIEQLIKAGAPPHAFDSQMASIIKSDDYLSALLQRCQAYKRYVSQNLKRLRIEFASNQEGEEDYPQGSPSEYPDEVWDLPVWDSESDSGEVPQEEQHVDLYYSPDNTDMSLPSQQDKEAQTDSIQADIDRRKRILNERIASVENEIDGINLQIERQQKGIDQANDAIQRIKDKEDWQKSYSAGEQINRCESQIYRAKSLQKQLKQMLRTTQSKLRNLQSEERSL